MTPHKKSGFTLIEMVVTIAILALLAGIATPRLSSLVTKGRVTRAQADCDAVAKAIMMYHTEYGRYPGGVQEDPTYNYQGPGGTGFAALTDDLVNGPIKFISKDIGVDPWGNNYCYHIYTRGNPYQDFVVFSMGPNGSSQSWNGGIWNTGKFAGDDVGAMYDN